MKNRSLFLPFLLLFLLISISLTPAAAQEEGESQPENPALENLTFDRSAGSEAPALDAPASSPGGSPPQQLYNQPREGGEVQAQQFGLRSASPESLTLTQPTNPPAFGRINALVVLSDPAALEVVPGANLDLNAASVAAANVRSRQRTVAASVTSVDDIELLASLTYTANALVVSMDASLIEAVEALPGVEAVIPDRIGTLDNANSVPFINTLQAWEAAGGFTGDGIRIGIIDSGIDYTHANFGGSGEPTVYDTNNTATIADIGYDGSKVAGGYDFVGDTWTAGAPFVPDDDPVDCNGHGSHVAGTAAGFGVNEDGTTYTGPWDNSVPFNDMTIGPGVAPEATLYALKIGACTTSVSFVAAAQALEFALDPNGDSDTSDHLDVINNSYGGAYGTPLEVLEEQMNLAAQSGIIIVTSAGNETDTYFVTGDPGAADWVISTASSVNDTVYGGLEVTTGPGGAFPSYPTVIPANPSQSGATGEFGPYPLRMVGGTGNSQGCAVADYDGFAGEAGLIVWTAEASGCGSATRMTNAVNAGDVAGLVVVSANPADFPFISLACAFGSGDSPLPCVSVTAEDGAILANDPSAFTVRFDSSLQAGLGGTSIGDMLSSFSSRGPRMEGGTGEIVLKPDITAPGDSIFSTAVGTGTEGQTLGGTSMASPHVAGVAALMRQVHPGWSVPEIKALMMNTATHDLWTEPNQSGDNYGVSRVGAGRVDVGNALNSEVIAYSATHPERVSVSFGLIEVVDSVSISQSITIENLGSTPQTYDVSFAQRNDVPGAQFSVSPSQITVPAGGTTAVTVTLTANKASMANANVPDPTTPTTQVSGFGNLPRHRIMEEGGYVVLTSTDSVSDLRVPVHAAPRPSADMQAVGPVQIGQGDEGFAALQLTGDEVFTGTNFPNDVISQVTAFELVTEDPQLPPMYSALGSADVQYVGVTSDYLSALTACGGDTTCAINNTTVYFGISVYGQWSTITGFDTWFDIGVDSDEDNLYDTTLFNFDSGYLFGIDFTDTILSWYTNGGSWLFGVGNPLGADFINGLPANTLETYAYNNSVIVMPVAATAMGLSAGNTDFQFDLYTLSSFIDTDYLGFPEWLTYDIANAAYFFGDANGFVGGPYFGIPMWNDTDGNAIPVDYNVTGLTDPLPPILLLHHHNAKDAQVGRAEVVEVVRSTDMDAVVVKTVDNDIPNEGDSVTFTITVSNNGPGVLEDPVITDTLPAGLTYVSDTCPVASSVTPAGGSTSIVCDLTGATIPAAFGVEFDIVASVDAGTNGSTLVNEAELTDYNPSTTDLDTGNNYSAVSVCVGGTAGSCNPTLQVVDILDENNVSLMTNPVVGTQIDQAHVQFNMPVRTGDGEDGAENPDNYRFLAEGGTPGFQTATCTAPVDSGDNALPFTVSHDAGDNTSVLDLTGSSLPEGNYRIIVCGSTSIVSTQDDPLNGGFDTVVDFEVNFTTGVTTPIGGGTGAGTGGESVLSPEQLEGMELPSTGETPFWQPAFIVLAGAGAGLLLVGRYIYHRRSARQ